jgi:hypothetical protein
VLVTMRDTSPDAAAAQLDVQRRLGVAGRFRVASDMSEFARSLARSGLRSRQPKLAEPQLQRELLRLLYGFEGSAR